MTRTLLVAAGAALFTSGCYSHHHRHADPAPAMCALATCIGLSAVGAPPEVAVAGAVIAGSVVHHADHWHSHRCGCPSRWHGGYRMYWYGGHWEYYDDRGQCWRAIPEDRGPSW